ncbi:hypothetical protein [Candidatus Neptunochlamydia vexilliferae]|uniref:DUF7790 domain-containing protein n=1 Tax=Candidatus Neptunichlamydia vexilliferae TaxID=1651774 RepID=A0ABS0AZF8_9BACT|nr:hypothetical protein [Candidatus Neptunochlamydia vexilliferae]MBF5059509.1 hypothetical protein [Candidatus Neptunochlamydia vexilliferae]
MSATALKYTAPPALEKKGFDLVSTSPYIITSEIGQTDAIKTIIQKSSKKKGVLLGFAFEFNYNLLANGLEVDQAIICDIDEKMHELYQFIAKTIVRTPTKEEFLKAFKTELENRCSYYNTGREAEEVIEYYTLQAHSWLSTGPGFKKVRTLYQEKRIHHRNLNLFSDKDYFKKVATWAEKCQYIFKVIYVSNIPEWAYRQNKLSEMTTNLQWLLSPETIFVDTKQEMWESGKPKIRFFQGTKLPSSRPNIRVEKRERSQPLNTREDSRKRLKF